MQPPDEEVVFESETTDERVEFNQAPAGEAPELRRSTRESKPRDIWTYSHAQATKMAKHIHTCFLQTNSLNAGLKEFGQEGYDAAYKEIGQLHGRGGLTPTGLRDLTDEEAKRALEAVTILLQKKSGVVKSRTCANGSVQRNWMTKEEVTSPTALTESVLLTGLYDAIEGRYVVMADLPNAFIQADINTKPGEPRTVLVIRGVLVDMLQKIAPDVYNKYVEYKKGKKVLYLVVNKAIYGMIESPMLWYMKFHKDLESQGFEINPYDPCVANKRVKGTYLTVVWHVDDLKISHKRKQVVEDFVKWLDKTYSDKNGKVTVTRGTKHVYLGMILDYSTPGVLKVDMRDYVSNMLQEFRKDQKIGTLNRVAWTGKLFTVDDSNKSLPQDKAELFHTFTAKSLFLCKRARPDIQPAIAFLCTHVQKPTKQDWHKLHRMMKFLKATADDVLTLSADRPGVLNWYWDASFAVYQDYKSHTRGTLTMGRGSIFSASKKQKLNTRSLTEAELVAVDDGMSSILWTKLFLEAQGHKVIANNLHQDNKSAILLEKNGKASSSKRTRRLNIRYFFVTNQVSKGNLTIKFCPTDEMLGDYFTKPTTGTKFHTF